MIIIIIMIIMIIMIVYVIDIVDGMDGMDLLCREDRMVENTISDVIEQMSPHLLVIK